MRSTSNLTLGEVIHRQLHEMCGWAGLPYPIRKNLESLYKLFTEESLNQQPVPPFAGLSFINANGLPFQWSLCIGSEHRSVRFVCETGTPGLSPELRSQHSQKCIEIACELLDINYPSWLWESVFAYGLPPPGEWPIHWRSAIWIGVGASSNGIMIKPYINLNRDSPLERWQRIGWILKSLGKNDSLKLLCDLSGQVSADSWPTGLAVDILPNGFPGRIKVYFHSGEVQLNWLHRWYDAVGASQESFATRKLLDSFPWIGSGCYPPKSFVVSLEFHKKDGEVSLKTDLAITRWMKSDRQIANGIEHILADIGLDRYEYTSAIQTLGAWPHSHDEARVFRYVGIGYEPDGSHHVNIYIEPPLEKSKEYRPRHRQNGVHKAIQNGINYILDVEKDSHWVDFELPVGESDCWVTAYVLYKLARISFDNFHPYENPKINKAIDWLINAKTPGGGWGYSQTTENDADSTSLAVLALREFNRPVSQDAVDFVLQCLVPDGGAATYPKGMVSKESWSKSIPDITPLVLLTLLNDISESQFNDSLLFLENSQQEDGTWPSFWWLTRLYATLSVIEQKPKLWTIPRISILQEKLLHFNALGAFETALLLSCKKRLGINGNDHSLLSCLIEEQKLDGSWQPSAFLRLTNPNISDPWNQINSGSIFLDNHGVFTTATAIYALSLEDQI